MKVKTHWYIFFILLFSLFPFSPLFFSPSSLYPAGKKRGTKTVKTEGKKKNQLDFRLAASFFCNPFFYEWNYQMSGYALSGELYLGGAAQKMGIGGRFKNSYFNMDGKNPNKQLVGFWNIFSGFVTIDRTIKKLVMFEWGAGGAWNYSSVYFNNSNLYSRNEGGPAFAFNVTIMPPWRILDFTIINNLYLFFDHGFTTNSHLYPYYNGGVRLSFFPYIRWFTFYVELTGLVWNYKIDDTDFTTGLIVVQMGITLDVKFPGIFDDMKKVENDINRYKMVRDRLNNSREPLKILEEGGSESVITFHEIRFEKRSIKLEPFSLPVLDKIAAVLKKHKSLKVLISAYSDSLDDPLRELELSVRRAKIIRLYLIKKGISGERLEVVETGNVAVMLDEESDLQNYSGIKVKILYR